MIAKPSAIKLLSAHAGLIHGFSPRYMEPPDGTRIELDFRSMRDEEPMLLHRRMYLKSLGIEDQVVYRVRQVHGHRVYELKHPLISVEKVADTAADAIVTRVPNQPVAVLTADCVPVVIYDPRSHAVGVVHAGRKGTSQNILSKTVKNMQNTYGSRPEELVVGMGPGIGGCCYEVDASCIEPFKKRFAGWSRFSQKLLSGKFMLDLFAANIEDARMAGLDPERISQTGLCTSCEAGRFFSYRREGTAGRMMTVAMLSRIERKGI